MNLAVTIPRREWQWIGTLTLLIVGFANLPYLLAYTAPAPHVFGGILFNPFDGYSYLAKLREGWRGEWLFTLPYTAQPGPGAFIFTFHLALGHLARITGLSLELVYHLTRLLTSTFFLLTAYHFIARFLDSFRSRLAAWLMFGFASGLGWLAAPLGGFTSDLWVAEAYPFLTIFSNAHFPLTWALLLWLFEWTLPGLAPPPSLRHLALVALVVTLQAQVQPMVLLTLNLILGGMVVGRWVTTRTFIRAEWLTMGVVGLASAPWVLNALWITYANPALAAWNVQNLTPSPPWWDAVLSGGVPLLLASVGLWVAARRRNAHDQILLYWFILGLLSIYAPIALQRRLSLGLWMPLILLAFIGLREVIWPHIGARWRTLALTLLVIPMVMSNLLVYVSVLAAVQKRDTNLFLSEAEAAALNWLADNADGALVLASPTTSLVIPARTDARVVYGHPFETVGAEAHKQAVENFFTSQILPATFLAQYPIDYIFFGPREQVLGTPILSDWRIVFQQDTVTIYGR